MNINQIFCVVFHHIGHKLKEGILHKIRIKVNLDLIIESKINIIQFLAVFFEDIPDLSQSFPKDFKIFIRKC